MWIKSKEFKKILGLSNQALYERRKKGQLKFKKVNGIFFYWLEENIETDTNRYNVIHCRVSNNKQKDDLDKQEQILKEYAISNGYKVDYIFKDTASGMNESRKDLNELIKLVVENKVNKVFISYKDRLTRFGYNYFEYIFKMFGTEIEVVNLTKEEDFQTELTQDLISIIHHFSMKMYSNRKNKNLWKRELFINNLTKRLNILGINIFKVNPAYSSFIGNLRHDYTDAVNASIEIARRGFEYRIKKNKTGFYPNLLVKHQWKETATKYTDWKKFFIEIKNLKLKYRVSLDECLHKFNVFQQNSSSKSMVLNYTFYA